MPGSRFGADRGSKVVPIHNMLRQIAVSRCGLPLKCRERREPESAEHLALKKFIAAHPERVGLPKNAKDDLEKVFGSGDRADAFSQVMNAASRGLGPAASPFDWEMVQLYQTGRLGSTTFMKVGDSHEHGIGGIATAVSETYPKLQRHYALHNA